MNFNKSSIKTHSQKIDESNLLVVSIEAVVVVKETVELNTLVDWILPMVVEEKSAEVADMAVDSVEDVRNKLVSVLGAKVCRVVVEVGPDVVG